MRMDRVCPHPESERRPLEDDTYRPVAGRSVCGACGEMFIERRLVVEHAGGPPGVRSRFT